jgi:solute carrier family 30 (zinc transporter), member 5/7
MYRSSFPLNFFPDYLYPCQFCSVVLVSQFSLAWGKTLSSATFVSIFTLLTCIPFPSPSKSSFFKYSQHLRFTPIILALVLSFASDTRYSLNDVLETLPGYLALLLHILATGASEHLRSTLAPSVGAKYASVFNTVGAATFCLVVYVAREILVSILQSSPGCHWSHVSQL